MILVKLMYIVHTNINNLCLIIGLICKKAGVDKSEHAWVCFVGLNYSLNQISIIYVFFLNIGASFMMMFYNKSCIM